MKRIFFICFIFVFIQINSSFAKQRELSKGKAVVFGVDVLLRSLPSQNSNILDVIPIASKIEIIDKASLLTNIGNDKDFWYKVKYNETEGYIWGAEIADNFFEKENEGSLETFMILNFTKEYNDEGSNTNTSRIEFRLAQNGQLLHEHKRFTNYSFLCDTIKFETLENFTTKINVLRILYNFSGESKGKAEEFYTFNNNIDSLLMIDYIDNLGSSISYCNAIFPTDKDGIKNCIILNWKICNDASLFNETQGDRCQWEYSKEILEWNGKKFNLKK